MRSFQNYLSGFGRFFVETVCPIMAVSRLTGTLHEHDFLCAGRSGSVKGCKMPAPNRKHVRIRKDSTGRRLTSLEGGNRGMLRCGYFSVPGYGDLKVVFAVRVDSAADD